MLSTLISLTGGSPDLSLHSAQSSPQSMSMVRILLSWVCLV